MIVRDKCLEQNLDWHDPSSGLLTHKGCWGLASSEWYKWLWSGRMKVPIFKRDLVYHLSRSVDQHLDY